MKAANRIKPLFGRLFVHTLSGLAQFFLSPILSPKKIIRTKTKNLKPLHHDQERAPDAPHTRFQRPPGSATNHTSWWLALRRGLWFLRQRRNTFCDLTTMASPMQQQRHNMLIQENAELRQALHQMTEKYNKFLQGKQGGGGWAAVISGVDGFCCCCCRHFLSPILLWPPPAAGRPCQGQRRPASGPAYLIVAALAVVGQSDG